MKEGRKEWGQDGSSNDRAVKWDRPQVYDEYRRTEISDYG